MSCNVWQVLSGNAGGQAGLGAAGSQQDSSVVVVGQKHSGKSSLLQTLFSSLSASSSSKPKPTVSLDYKFLKHQFASSSRELTHFYEIGGGESLMKLTEVAVTSQSLEDCLVLIVVDLSNPRTAIDSAIKWSSKLRSHVGNCMAKLEKKEPAKAAGIMNRLSKEWENHPDRKRIVPIPVNHYIIGHKFDSVAKSDTETLKVLGRTLRAIAHSSGAGLCFTSCDHKGSMENFRSIVTRHMAGKDRIEQFVVDPINPIAVSPRKDTVDQIGSPPAEYRTLPNDPQVQAWLSACNRLFPEEKNSNAALEALKLEDLKLEPEQDLDGLLTQKNEEFKAVARQAALTRKLKLQAAEGELKDEAPISSQ